MDLASPIAVYRHELDRAVRAGYTRRDLMDAGATDYAARAALRRAELQIGPLGYVDVPVPTPGPDVPAVVALAPSGGRAKGTIEAGYYLRARSLRQPIRRIATHLGTDGIDTLRVLDRIAPITARVIVDTTRPHAPTHPNPQVAAQLTACWASGEIGDYGPVAELFLLGAPLPGVAIPVDMGTGGIPGVRHHQLDVLLASPAVTGTPTV